VLSYDVASNFHSFFGMPVFNTEGKPMRKLIPIVIATLFATGAYAQNNPPGSTAPANSPGLANSPSQGNAEMRKGNRADVPVQNELNQKATGVAGTAVPDSDRAVKAAERRKANRVEKPVQNELNPKATGVAGTAIPAGRAEDNAEMRKQQRIMNSPAK